MAPAFPQDRERLAPIPLARKEPVAQLVVDRAAAELFFLQPGGDRLFGLGRGKAVEETGVDGGAVIGKSAPLFSRPEAEPPGALRDQIFPQTPKSRSSCAGTAMMAPVP